MDKTDIEITDNLINFLFKEDQLNLVPGPEEASVQERLTKVLNAVVRNTCRSAQCSSSFFFSFYLSFISLSFSLLLFFFLLSNEFDSYIGKASLLHLCRYSLPLRSVEREETEDGQLEEAARKISRTLMDGCIFKKVRKLV